MTKLRYTRWFTSLESRSQEQLKNIFIDQLCETSLRTNLDFKTNDTLDIVIDRPKVGIPCKFVIYRFPYLIIYPMIY